MKYCLIYITCGSEEEAETISTTLVEKKLIACANYFPIKSVYRWKSGIEKENEHLLLCKTQQKLFKKITDAVLKLHSYDVPAITMIPVAKGHDAYLDWVDENTR